jgi:hypothetical protein
MTETAVKSKQLITKFGTVIVRLYKDGSVIYVLPNSVSSENLMKIKVAAHDEIQEFINSK